MTISAFTNPADPAHLATPAMAEGASPPGGLVHTPPTREQIEALAAAMGDMPQLDLPLEHRLVGGMYCRSMAMPVGSLVVGCTHRKAHLFMLTKGFISVGEAGREPLHLQAPMVLESPPGTQRVIYAHSDAVITTVHRTDKATLPEIEADLIEAGDLQARRVPSRWNGDAL